MRRLLFIEDDPDIRGIICSVMTSRGFECLSADNFMAGFELLKTQSVDGILLDFYVGQETALEYINAYGLKSPNSKIIILTGQGSIKLAVECMERGASYFITKDTELQKLADIICEKVATTKFGLSNAATSPERFGMVGQSRNFSAMYEQISAIAAVDTNVMISGESGTGKELVAKTIHQLSTRANGPFEAINCGAIPENLLESELFGYRKGAFTDAKNDRKGIFEACSGGTLFLDEIADLPKALQVKLLRAIQEREIRPLGSSSSVRVDTRILAATNRDLLKATTQGEFREDLYFRLSVIPLHVPPLRERKEDIALLAKHFWELFTQRYSRRMEKIDPELLRQMVDHSWPGNVRQLSHAVERAVLLSSDGKIHSEHIFADRSNFPIEVDDSIQPMQSAREAFEKSYLMKLLTVSRGNLSEAARLSGRVRSDIYRLIGKYQIQQGDFRAMG